NYQKDVHLNNFSYYTSEYDDMNFKLRRIDETHKEILVKHEELCKEVYTLKNEKSKFENCKNSEIEKLKNQNEKLKEKYEQVRNDHNILLNKYLLTEKKIYKIEKEKKEEINQLQDAIQKGEMIKTNSVENLNKVKDILSKSMQKAEENIKKLLEVEKDRDGLKIKNEYLFKSINELKCKEGKLKNALKIFEKKYKQVIEKNNAMFAITHEFLNQKNSKIGIFRKNCDIKQVCQTHKIDKIVFDDINCFSTLYMYEIVYSSYALDSDESVEEEHGGYEEDEEEEPWERQRVKQRGRQRDKENEMEWTLERKKNKSSREENKYIKIKKSKYRRLNYLLNEAQMKIISLSRSYANFEKNCANVKNALLNDDLNIYKKHYYSNPANLFNEKTYIENILQQKVEQIQDMEIKLKEKENTIQKQKENIFRLNLEKETLIKVISALPNFSSFVQIDKNNKTCSIENFVETTVRDYVYQQMKCSNMLLEISEVTPSNVSNNNLSVVHKGARNESMNRSSVTWQTEIHPSAGNKSNGSIEEHMSSNFVSGSVNRFDTSNANQCSRTSLNGDNVNQNNKKMITLHHMVEEDLEKAIVSIENKQMSYFRKSNLLNYIDDYMVTLDIFARISQYNDQFKVENLLEDGFTFVLENIKVHSNGARSNNLISNNPSGNSRIGNDERGHYQLSTYQAIVEELERSKKNQSDEELLRHIEEVKLLDKYKQFYHDHFLNINNIFNTLISFNLYSIMDDKYKNVYERYFNLFNLNFSNVEISFDLLLRRFHQIVRLSKKYERVIIEKNKKMEEMDINEMDLYKCRKKLEYDIEAANKEKENLGKIIEKKEEHINVFNEKYLLLQNEYEECKNKNIFINELCEMLKKEKYNLEQELCEKEQKNVKLNDKNSEIIKSYQKEKDYLHSLLEETRDNNIFLKEKLENILNQNESLKYDYDIRLNQLNTLWLEEKENNKKISFDMNNLKVENNSLVLKVNELQNKNSLVRNELRERIKQINMYRNSFSVSKQSIDGINNNTVKKLNYRINTTSYSAGGISSISGISCTNNINGTVDIINSSGNNEIGAVNVNDDSYMMARGSYVLAEDEREYRMEYELLLKKLKENIADLNAQILQLKGEKDILITSIETWRCFSVNSKEEIKRLKKICSEQLEKHKEFLLINQSNEEKLKYINDLLNTEKNKYEKDVNEIKEKLKLEIDKVKEDLKEKIYEIKILQYDKDNLIQKIKLIENENKEGLDIKKKEEEYVNLIKHDKATLQKEYYDILQKYNIEMERNKKLSNQMDVLITSHKEEIRLINEKLNTVKKENLYLNEIIQKQVNLNDNELLKSRLEQLVQQNKDLQIELQQNLEKEEKIKFENVELKEKLNIEKEKLTQQQTYIVQLKSNLTDPNIVDKNDDFITSLKCSLEKSRRELQSITDQFEKLQLNEQKNIMRVQLLEDKLAHKEIEKKKLEEMIENKNTDDIIQYNKIKTDLDILVEENRILLMRKEEYEEQIEQLKRENDLFVATKNNDMNIIERDKLKEQVSQHLVKINEKEKTIINLNFQIKKLNNEIDEMKKRFNMDVNNSIVGNVNPENLEQQQMYNDNNNYADRPTNEQQNVSLEIYKYINENIDLTAELENKYDVIEKCKDEIKLKNDEIDKLNKDISILSKRCNQFEESLIIMEKHKLNMNNHIKEKDEIIKNLKKKRNNKVDDLLFSNNYSTDVFGSFEHLMNATSYDEIVTMVRGMFNREANSDEGMDVSLPANFSSDTANGGRTNDNDKSNDNNNYNYNYNSNDNNNYNNHNNNDDDNEGKGKQNGLTRDRENIIVIKCNILKLFKLWSFYLYIINLNLKEIQILKKQVSSLEENIESLNQFINNLKDENNKNELINVSNLEHIIELKGNIQNNENFIKNLNNDIKKNEQLNDINIKNIYKYKRFIIHLIQQNTLFFDIFKNFNEKKKVDISILNKLNNLKKSFSFYMYDSIIDELRNNNNSSLSSSNYDFTEEQFRNVQAFTNRFNLIIDRGNVHVFNNSELSESDQDTFLSIEKRASVNTMCNNDHPDSSYIKDSMMIAECAIVDNIRDVEKDGVVTVEECQYGKSHEKGSSCESHVEVSPHEQVDPHEEV
ncbi:conserved Plasmodium protein, unknown function, partial [Plasmodium malariae]